MKIRYLLAVLLFAFSSTIYAQDNDLYTQGAASQLHLVHKVAAKENLYSIGRMYNLAYKDIATFNNLKENASLSIGQVLKIPLSAANFSQNGNKGGDEVLVPVYHVVQEKEWMFRISQNHNKVPVEKLQEWNNISNDDLKAGMKLVVGFLKVKNQSALASRAKNIQSNQPPVVVNTKKPEVSTPAVKEEKKEVVDKADPIVKSEKPAVTDSKPVSNKSINYNGGYFRNQFGGAGKAANGTAGIFKSTSGWQDGKYYALMNNVPVGTIIRIDHPVTRRSVYAKVLGQLPDMKESAGLAIRLSDAAAAELGAGAYKFTVDVSY
ncbi:MAG TPA: LysM peptidoglycan-binding domain-containing protein [Chitinophagaceae bacterium]